MAAEAASETCLGPETIVLPEAEIRNPNVEIRNKSEIQISKPQTPCLEGFFSIFCFLAIEICFGFEISYFGFDE